MNEFELYWLNGEAQGFLDRIPVIWFNAVGKLRGIQKHAVKKRGLPEYKAACHVEVFEQRADITYLPAHNKINEVFPGVLRLVFATSGRNTIKKIEWADYGEELDDVTDIIRWGIRGIETTKDESVKIRISQGKFRDELILRYEGKCAVTGIDILEALRASHIKPWSECSHTDRRDPDNGLLLSANLDALFDAGLISFSSSGKLLKHPRLFKTKGFLELAKWRKLRAPLNSEQKKFLAVHRRKYGFQDY